MSLILAPRPAVRGLLLAACLAGTGLLAACDEQAASSQSFEPVEITTGTSCELDGMLLGDYPGPKAQIHYAGQERPAFFCDTVEMFNTLLAAEQVRAVRAVYVQDMAKADWNQPRGNWFPAATGYYVLGSNVHGSMGPTIASFAQQADAERFAQEHGGKVLHYADVSLDMVDLRGGALHDTRM